MKIKLGLKENWKQFLILVIVNAFVGAMVGLERTVIPLLAEEEFGLVSNSAVLSFLISFGLVKALANMFAGRLSDLWGRKKILIIGWLFGLPIPFLIIFAPTWGWIVFANVLLGINQGLCWSTTVVMKIDLVGPKQRGTAMGINEFAGYVAVSLSALATGYLAAEYGLRPIPFLPGVGFAFLGLLISIIWVKDTQSHVDLEAKTQTIKEKDEQKEYTFGEIFAITSWKNKTLFAASQSGMVNNLNDGVVWGLVPLYLAAKGLGISQIAVIAAVYPGAWGLLQLFTGALSDRWGRKWMIATGMWVQAGAIVLLVQLDGFGNWVFAASLLGLGTAMVYPTLLAAISDVAHPSWRASAVGVYRLWRDGGFAVGAVVAGLLADGFGISVAILSVGGLTLLSGLIVAVVMQETLKPSI